jgi:hypothetical protein
MIMNRTLSLLAAASLFAAVAGAQCGTFSSAAPAVLIGQGDDTFFTGHVPLGFTFTMAGSAGTTNWTHFRASTNGWLVLTDGTTTTGAPTGSSYGSVAAASASSLYGATASNPRVAPYWGDLNSTGAGNGVYYDTTTAAGVSCKVSWINVVDFGNAVQKSFAAEIFANGQIRFSYSSGMNYNSGGSKYVGLSASNGTAVQTAANLVPGPSSTTGGAMHQVFTTAGSLDTGGSELTFVPAGAGWNQSVTCQVLPASHTAYGTGCYNISDSAYQLFADAAVAAPALTGTAYTFTLNGGGTSYIINSTLAAYAPPSIAATNVFAVATDDGEAPPITLPAPLTTPQGPQTAVRVHSNGLVSWGAAAQTFPGSNSFTPTAAAFLAAANPAIWFWHDYNEAEALSGRIVQEVVGGSLHVTWNGVENYASPEVANPSTVQLQINPTTNVLTLIFVNVDSNNTTTFGSAHLIGYSPGGASNNAGSINLAASVPVNVPTLNVAALALSAAPAPVSTIGSGTTVVYTQSNIPEAAPASGVYFGLTIISLSQNLGGFDLTGIGMPGCSLYVNSLDVTIAYAGATNSQTTSFAIPAGLAYGTQFYAQSAALVVPGSLPNGQNAFGATVSNGIASFVSAF